MACLMLPTLIRMYLSMMDRDMTGLITMGLIMMGLITMDLGMMDMGMMGLTMIARSQKTTTPR